jgi:hypothetical protein
MSNPNIIPMTNNIFTISRNEGWGYVKHYVEFDAEYLDLKEKNIYQMKEKELRAQLYMCLNLK